MIIFSDNIPLTLHLQPGSTSTFLCIAAQMSMWAVYIETRLLYLPDGPSTVIPNSSESVTGDLAPLGFATITPLWPPKRFSRCWVIWPEHGRNQTKECRMEWKSTRWLPEFGWWDLHIKRNSASRLAPLKGVHCRVQLFFVSPLWAACLPADICPDCSSVGLCG